VPSVRERDVLPATRDYSTVTEVPGVLVTGEAFRMAHSRYAFAAEHCEGRDVLEIACGAGPGLGRECYRVLRRLGSLILCSVNCGWRDFHPSPFNTRYFSSSELRGALAETGFEAELYGGFPRRRARRGPRSFPF